MKTCQFCKCGLELIPKPVPGAIHYPRRLECPACGWDFKYGQSYLAEGDEHDRPNDYLTEVASPADRVFDDENEVVDAVY